MRKFLCVLSLIVAGFSAHALEGPFYVGVSLNVGINENKDINSYLFPIRPEVYIGENMFTENRLLGFHWDFTCMYGIPSEEKSSSYDLALEGAIGPCFRVPLSLASFYFSPAVSAGIAFGELAPDSFRILYKTESFFQAFFGFGGEAAFELKAFDPVIFGVRGFYFPFCYTDATYKYSSSRQRIEDYSPRYEFSIFVAFKLN